MKIHFLFHIISIESLNYQGKDFKAICRNLEQDCFNTFCWQLAPKIFLQFGLWGCFIYLIHVFILMWTYTGQ